MARGAHGWPSLHICRAAGEANIDEVNRSHRGPYHELNISRYSRARGEYCTYTWKVRNESFMVGFWSISRSFLSFFFLFSRVTICTLAMPTLAFDRAILLAHGPMIDNFTCALWSVRAPGKRRASSSRGFVFFLWFKKKDGGKRWARERERSFQSRRGEWPEGTGEWSKQWGDEESDLLLAKGCHSVSRGKKWPNRFCNLHSAGMQRVSLPFLCEYETAKGRRGIPTK